MANVNEFSQPIKYLNGGPLDAWAGPYPSVAAANAAIPNTVDANGRNMRKGKTVLINDIEYRWIGGFEDINLINSAKNTIKTVLFSPELTGDDYSAYASIKQPVVAVPEFVVSTNSDGKLEANCVSGKNLYGVSAGLRNYKFLAGRTYECSVTYYLDGSFNQTTYFIYNQGGNRIVKVPSYKIHGKYLSLYYTLDTTAGDCELELFGFQVETADLSPSAVKISIDKASFLIDSAQNINENTETLRIKDFLRKQLGEPVTIIKVSPLDGQTGFAFTGKNAIQHAINSITDASEGKRYIVRCARGIYKVSNSSEFIGNPGYPALVMMKDYISLEGEGIGKTILYAELPYDETAIDTSISREKHQTLWNQSKEAHVSDLTVIAKNLRYTIHQDAPAASNSSRKYENVEVIFLGDKGFKKPWGLGSWAGEINEVVGGRTQASVNLAWSCHTSLWSERKNKWRYTKHEFCSPSSHWAIETVNSGSMQPDELELIGCSLTGMGYLINYTDQWQSGVLGRENFDHAEWRLTGYGNSPFLFRNTGIKGNCLRITSKSIGLSSKVAFDTSASAFPLLIKNPYTNVQNLWDGRWNYIDGYMGRDGTPGLSGFAFGNVDVSEDLYLYDTSNVISLGKRLGNCSSVNKTLIILVDNVSHTVTFNKDYRSISNADIIAEINAVIYSVATADLWTFGKEYYPEMSDVLGEAVNASTTVPIKKGTILTLSGQQVAPANEGDKIYGVALDDIPVFEYPQGLVTGHGRVLKRGYISTSKTDRFNVLIDTEPTASGQKYTVTNGSLILDTNGKILARDTGVIAINC